ncbi:hypothetical protein MRB53_037119 [Persea americana]|nr:hypothetical protein MRB53_037119 [Persea americana]
MSPREVRAYCPKHQSHVSRKNKILREVDAAQTSRTHASPICRPELRAFRTSSSLGSTKGPQDFVPNVGRFLHELAVLLCCPGAIMQDHARLEIQVPSDGFAQLSIFPHIATLSTLVANDTAQTIDTKSPTSTNTSPPKSPIKTLNRHENIYTLPNILTASRLLATPAVGYLILTEQHTLALALFFYAGVTDLLDGWIARKWHLQTVVGTVIDPLADKALMTVLTVCLALKGALPVWLATMILGRDVSLAIAAIFYRYASLPRPKTLARYWDFSLPSAEVRPTGISKANTFLQLLLIGATVALPVAGPAVDSLLAHSATMQDLGFESAQTLMMGAQWLVAGTTAWSGVSYLYTKDAVRILTPGASDAEKKRVVHKGRAILGASFVACLALALGLER